MNTEPKEPRRKRNYLETNFDSGHIPSPEDSLESSTINPTENSRSSHNNESSNNPYSNSEFSFPMPTQFTQANVPTKPEPISTDRKNKRSFYILTLLSRN